MLMLVTGATGKVGRAFLARISTDPSYRDARFRALCHNRMLEPNDRLDVVKGSISDRAVVERAMDGVTHVVHLATCKETPDDVMDITVKGMFWLLESFRESPTAQQFILIGGDAAVGHFFYRREDPLTEATPHAAYPGCYALSKVLEEVMLEQVGIQYGINHCCLRAPWIMAADDFRYTLSFGDDVFGGPDWKTMVPAEDARRYHLEGVVPLLLDANDRPLKRNFVHVDDLVEAIIAAIDNPRAERQLFNVCMDRPVDYGEVADYLQRTRGLDSVEIRSEFHSVWMDNDKAKFALDWQPQYDLEGLVEAAWTHERAPDDPRVVWYPG